MDDQGLLRRRGRMRGSWEATGSRSSSASSGMATSVLSFLEKRNEGNIMTGGADRREGDHFTATRMTPSFTQVERNRGRGSS